MSNKNLTIGLVVAIIIALIGVFTPAAKTILGGATNYDELDATAIKIGGTNGSRLGPIIETTGTPIVNVAGGGSVAASSTKAFDIAVTGIVSGDNVVAQFSTSTAASPEWGATSPKWTILGAKASTTAGFVTIVVQNQTGGTASFSDSGIATGTQLFISHPVSTVPGL